MKPKLAVMLNFVNEKGEKLDGLTTALVKGSELVAQWESNLLGSVLFYVSQQYIDDDANTFTAEAADT